MDPNHAFYQIELHAVLGRSPRNRTLTKRFGVSYSTIKLVTCGASEEARTLDLLLGKQMLYQLSYSSIFGGRSWSRTSTAYAAELQSVELTYAQSTQIILTIVSQILETLSRLFLPLNVIFKIIGGHVLCNQFGPIA